jgi:hypothetical protein
MIYKIVCGILIVSLTFYGCDPKRNKPNSFNEICKIVIDCSLKFDKALNQGDSLYLDLSNDFSFDHKDQMDILNYVSEKYKLNVRLSPLDRIIAKDTLYEKVGYLKNFFISVTEIKFINSKKIIIKSKKYKGKFAVIVIETIFEFNDKEWIFKSSKIISTS